MKLVLSETQYKSVLLEGRKERLAKKYEGKFSNGEQIINTVLNDPFNIQTNHKYSDFMLKSYQNFEGLNHNDLVDTVKYFDEKQRAFDEKDIDKYRNYQELKNVVDEHRQQLEDKKSVVKIFEDDTYLIIRPQTHKASCKYGAGTKWCTAMRDYPSHFETRSRNFKRLYYVMTKPLDKTNNLYKIAIYIDNGDETWFDSQDKKIELKLVESLKKVYLKDGYNSIKEDYRRIYSDLAEGVMGNLDSEFSKYVQNGYSVELNDSVSGSFIIEFSPMDEPDGNFDEWYHSTITFKYTNGIVFDRRLAGIQYDIVNRETLFGVDLNVYLFEYLGDSIIDIGFDDVTVNANMVITNIENKTNFERLFRLIAEKIHRLIPDNKKMEIGDRNPTNPNSANVMSLLNGLKDMRNAKFTFPGVITGDVDAKFILEIPGFDIVNQDEIENGYDNDVRLITQLAINRRGRIGPEKVEEYTLDITMRPHRSQYSSINVDTVIHFELDDSNSDLSFNLDKQKILTRLNYYLHNDNSTISKREIVIMMGRIARYLIDKHHMIPILNPNREEGNITWKPSRSYTYRFTRKDGTMIGKLVELLDSGWEGTRYDFLSYLYTGSREPNQWTPEYRRDMRGQNSYFFAQARRAGIIRLERRGRKAYIVKGHNFKAFKEGRLKAGN